MDYPSKASEQYCVGCARALSALELNFDPPPCFAPKYQTSAKGYLGAKFWVKYGPEHVLWHPLHRKWPELKAQSSKKLPCLTSRAPPSLFHAEGYSNLLLLCILIYCQGRNSSISGIAWLG
eukprot:1160012-Pelagomonas_calceolata.AAC.2